MASTAVWVRVPLSALSTAYCTMSFKEVVDIFAVDEYLQEAQIATSDKERQQILQTWERGYQLLSNVWQVTKTICDHPDSPKVDELIISNRFVVAAATVHHQFSYPNIVRLLKEYPPGSPGINNNTMSIMMKEWLYKNLATQFAAKDNGFWIGLRPLEDLAMTLASRKTKTFDEALEKVLPYERTYLLNKLEITLPREDIFRLMMGLVLPDGFSSSALFHNKEVVDGILDLHVNYISTSPIGQRIEIFKKLKELSKTTPPEGTTYIRGISHLINDRTKPIILDALQRTFGYDESEITMITNISIDDVLRGRVDSTIYNYTNPAKLVTVSYANIFYSEDLITDWMSKEQPPSLGILHFPAQKLFKNR